MTARLLLRTDGAARGNPGPASAGAVLIDADRPDATDPHAPPTSIVARPLGVQTNNVAEYTALVLALEEARRLAAREVDLRLDSKLIVEQLRMVGSDRPGLLMLDREYGQRRGAPAHDGD